MKKAVLTMFTVLSATLCLAQDYKAEFASAMEAKDTCLQREILSRWEKESPNPEVYIGWFEYYIDKAQVHRVALQKNKPAKGKFMEVKDSTGKTVAFLCPKHDHDLDIIRQGLGKMDEGIAAYPDRLDLRAKVIESLGECEIWPEMIKRVASTAKWGGNNGDKWVWPENDDMDDPQQAMIKVIQKAANRLYERTDSTNTHFMRALAKCVLRYYPDNVQNLTNLSISYMLDKDYDKALEQLEKAARIDPKDPVVLNNIGYCYSNKNDLQNALKYYKKAYKYGKGENKSYAEEAMKSIKERMK